MKGLLYNVRNSNKYNVNGTDIHEAENEISYFDFITEYNDF